ncbi:MAG TPA: PIG-L deacetylase family protein [Candidatus Sulfotelmatobacter sp.]|nr:PIG-L deacetylase family protein [Candidatus Sulfotelmatobacter sp.]
MKPVVGIFAHPDDEAFGPGGTLAQFVKEGREVYVICVTRGDAGENHSDKTHDIRNIREEEVKASASILGVKDVLFLNFKDGTLSNNLYHEVAVKLQEQIEKLQPEIIITLEPRGVSGHLDHIAVSFITTYVFKKLLFVKELWYSCLTEEGKKHLVKQLGNYFVYFPQGYKKSEITKIVDVSDVWEQKIAAIINHESQKPDVEAYLKAFQDLPHEEYYIVITRDME